MRRTTGVHADAPRFLEARTAARFGRGKCISISLAAVSVLLLLCDSCGPPAGTGDPGNHRLDQLRDDPVFASLPLGARLQGPVEKIPAKWRDNGPFEPSGWNGPAVKVTFVDAQPPSTVFAFYAAQATAAGWVGNGNMKDGYPEAWTKTFSGGWQGWLSLTDMSGATHKAGQAHVFVLNAAAPPILSALLSPCQGGAERRGCQRQSLGSRA